MRPLSCGRQDARLPAPLTAQERVLLERAGECGGWFRSVHLCGGAGNTMRRQPQPQPQPQRHALPHTAAVTCGGGGSALRPHRKRWRAPRGRDAHTVAPARRLPRWARCAWVSSGGRTAPARTARAASQGKCRRGRRGPHATFAGLFTRLVHPRGTGDVRDHRHSAAAARVSGSLSSDEQRQEFVEIVTQKVRCCIA